MPYWHCDTLMMSAEFICKYKWEWDEINWNKVDVLHHSDGSAMIKLHSMYWFRMLGWIHLTWWKNTKDTSSAWSGAGQQWWQWCTQSTRCNNISLWDSSLHVQCTKCNSLDMTFTTHSGLCHGTVLCLYLKKHLNEPNPLMKYILGVMDQGWMLVCYRA